MFRQWTFQALFDTSLTYGIPLGLLVLLIVTSGAPRYSSLVTIGLPEVMPPWRGKAMLGRAGGGVLLGGDRLIRLEVVLYRPSEVK